MFVTLPLNQIIVYNVKRDVQSAAIAEDYNSNAQIHVDSAHKLLLCTPAGTVGILFQEQKGGKHKVSP